MATIEKYCAPGVYDTPSYSQASRDRRPDLLSSPDRSPTPPTAP